VSSCIFTNDDVSIDYFTGNIKVGVVHVNDFPVMGDHHLPVTGRKLGSKILYNSRHAFDNFTKLKSINIKY
jgi:acyl-CoA reductase-like NAD-dependent aldehyde dehydrogenase